MGERSGVATLLLAVLTFVAALGVYFVIDNQDLVKRQQAETREAVQSLSEEVRSLRERIEQGGVRVAGTGADATQPENAAPRFANEEFYDADAEDGGQVIRSVGAFSGNANYMINLESTLGTLWGLCIDSLATRNNMRVTEFEPVLAERWAVSDDGLVYTIHLRKNAMWHPYVDPVTKKKQPARPVTADDFVFYWETLQNPDVPCDPHRTYLKLVETIEKIDDGTFKVIWKEPYSLAESVTLGLQPLPRHYYRSNSEWTDKEFAEQMMSSPRNQQIVGCGAYRFDGWEKGKFVRLSRYENYYGKRPSIKTLLFKEIQDPTIAFIEFKKGGVDRLGLQPSQWVKETPAPEFQLVTKGLDTAVEDSIVFDAAKRAGETPDDYKYEKYMYRSFSWYYVGYNMRRALFKDRAVRVAMTHGINRPRILREVYHDLGSVITGPFVPHSPYYDDSIEPYPFDLEKAKAMLQKAGWEDSDGDGYLDKDLNGDGTRERFSFSYIVTSSSVNGRKVASIIEQDMKKAGVEMSIKTVEWSVYTKLLEEWNFDVCMLGWAGGFESDPYQIWHGSQARLKKSSNHVGYDSPEADTLIETGRRTTSLTKRIEIYRKFHKLLHEDQPYTFMICPSSLVAQQKRYRNVRVFPGGMDAGLMWVPKTEQVAP